ncbi:MAG: hypothetical protein QM765_29560 [Myxococcales bacterium]
MGAIDHPQLAFDGTGYGIAWQDRRSSTDGVYFRRVDATGAEAGGETLMGLEGYWPAIAWNGTGYAVAWSDDSASTAGSFSPDIAFALVSTTGSVAAQQTVTAPDGNNYYASLAWTGSEYGLTFVSSNKYATNDNVVLARFSAAGVLQGSVVTLTEPDQGARDSSSACWTGTDYLVTWRQPGANNTAAIAGMRVDAAGAKLAGAWALTDPLGRGWTPLVAAGATSDGLVWQDLSGSGPISFREVCR